MGVPCVAGDYGVAYVFPGTPPIVASFPILGGSVKTFVNGQSIALFGQALTGGGPIVAGGPVTVKTLVEGRPVYLIGAVTNLGSGGIGGTLTGASAGVVQMS